MLPAGFSGPGGAGLAVFNSTPKGRIWFWRAYLKGQDPLEKQWESWTFPTTTNPHIDPAEIAAAEHDMPERWFRQEYLAEFIDDAGGVFRGVRRLVTGGLLDAPKHGRRYVMGVDWGRRADFTVAVLLDMTGRRPSLVAVDRFNKVDCGFQLERVKALSERFRASRIVVEENGVGDPLVGQLSRDLHNVQSFLTTNTSRRLVFESLAVRIERAEIGRSWTGRSQGRCTPRSWFGSRTRG